MVRVFQSLFYGSYQSTLCGIDFSFCSFFCSSGRSSRKNRISRSKSSKITKKIELAETKIEEFRKEERELVGALRKLQLSIAITTVEKLQAEMKLADVKIAELRDRVVTAAGKVGFAVLAKELAKEAEKSRAKRELTEAEAAKSRAKRALVEAEGNLVAAAAEANLPVAAAESYY